MMLTAVSTVLGLLPIAPTVFWGPMAFAIMGGLLVATLLTLIFLPALYIGAREREAGATGPCNRGRDRLSGHGGADRARDLPRGHPAAV